MTVMTVGQLVCMGIQPTGDHSLNEFKYEKLWNKTFSSQAICMVYEEDSNIVAVGLDDGTVVVVRILENMNYTKYEDIFEKKLH